MARLLLQGCVDVDHQVRGHAAGSIGLLNLDAWMALSTHAYPHIHPYPHRQGESAMTADIADEVNRIDPTTLLNALLKMCSDDVGTVRALAYKSLGEAVLSGCLYVIANGGGIHNGAIGSSSSSSSVGDLIGRILVCIQQGCVDSKLAVNK
jgi:hypothetical protein